MIIPMIFRFFSLLSPFSPTPDSVAIPHGLHFPVLLFQGLLHLKVRQPFLLDPLLFNIPDDSSMHRL